MQYNIDKQGVDISDKTQFPKSNRVFKAVLLKLKREGKGNVKHKDAVTWHGKKSKIVMTLTEYPCWVTEHIVY